mgnify:CR=1 FL=1
MFVYVLIDPQTNCIRYVGVTNDVERRYSQHLSCSNSKNFAKDCWVKSLRLQGLKPTLAIFEECEDEQKALDAEARWIQTGLRLGWPLLNFNKVELAEYPNKVSVEVAEWLLEKHRDKIVDHLVDALLSELKPKSEPKEQLNEPTDLEALVWAWRDEHPEGTQAELRSDFKRHKIEISKGHVFNCWHSWPGGEDVQE